MREYQFLKMDPASCSGFGNSTVGQSFVTLYTNASSVFVILLVSFRLNFMMYGLP
jgi:hypothetical protein